MPRLAVGWVIQKFLLLGTLSVFALGTLLPFLWTLSTSLKDDSAVREVPPRLLPVHAEASWTREGLDRPVRLLREEGEDLLVRLLDGDRKGEVARIPREQYREYSRVVAHWENYPRAWEAYPLVSFWRAYGNSLAVALLVTLGQLLTCSLAAFAFARLRFPGREFLFYAYLATMMVPGAVMILPTFVLLKNLPLALNSLFATDFFTQPFPFGGKVLGTDSYFALIVPRFFSAYGTFLLRQHFLTVPKELEEAARMDGCGSFGVLWRVILPLSKPGLATLGIFTFMWTWGDFLWPLLVTDSHEIYTLPLLLNSFHGQAGTQWNLMMAASLTATLPMLAVFLLGQRYFLEGIRLGALKG